MILRRIYDERVFDDATTDARRAAVYVRSGELGLSTRADVDLMSALTGASPQRVHLVGPSGAGKTSLILRVVADLAGRRLEVSHEVLILRVGDRPDRLGSGAEVMKMVLETIAAHGHRFSNVDPEVLQAAAADQRTRTPTQIEHRGGLTAPVVSYTASLKEAYETIEMGQNAARVRQDLEDVLALVRRAGHRPVLVLDDTEKFVSPGPAGTLDETSVENLYHHGVRVLGELEVDLVVAVHPRFEEVDHVVEVVDRLAMGRIEVPELPPDVDEPALGLILGRRMDRAGVEATVDRVIERAAVDELQVLYHERDHDLRSVLKLAHASVAQALERDAEVVAARDVRSALAMRP